MNVMTGVGGFTISKYYRDTFTYIVNYKKFTLKLLLKHTPCK
jgi:hypothetical protein